MYSDLQTILPPFGIPYIDSGKHKEDSRFISFCVMLAGQKGRPETGYLKQAEVCIILRPWAFFLSNFGQIFTFKAKNFNSKDIALETWTEAQAFETAPTRNEAKHYLLSSPLPACLVRGWLCKTVLDTMLSREQIPDNFFWSCIIRSEKCETTDVQPMKSMVDPKLSSSCVRKQLLHKESDLPGLLMSATYSEGRDQHSPDAFYPTYPGRLQNEHISK